MTRKSSARPPAGGERSAAPTPAGVAPKGAKIDQLQWEVDAQLPPISAARNALSLPLVRRRARVPVAAMVRRRRRERALSPMAKCLLCSAIVAFAHARIAWVVVRTVSDWSQVSKGCYFGALRKGLWCPGAGNMEDGNMRIGVARGDGHRFFTRFLAAAALIAVYCLGTVGIVMSTGPTPAFARGRGGRGGGRGRGGRGFRGRGRGGIGIYLGGYGDGCWWSRRWRRWVCPYY